MKGSSATSAKATGSRPRTGRSSAGPPPSLTSAEPISLGGPSDLPDPTRCAYRRDLADVALAGRVIASHYAEPMERTLARAEDLRAAPEAEAEKLARLAAGETFRMLDDSVGWAWGYGGADAIVGYVPSEALAR